MDESQVPVEVHLTPRRDSVSFVVDGDHFICPNETCESVIPFEYIVWNDYPLRVDKFSCPLCNSIVEFHPFYDTETDRE